MSARNWGNGPLFSTTAASVSNPSTASICAEVILPAGTVPSETYELRWGVGASTSAIWLLEQCLSSGLGSTAIEQQLTVFTGTNQTSEFVTTQTSTSVMTGQARFRVRLLSTFTGTAGCWIQAEPVT